MTDKTTTEPTDAEIDAVAASMPDGAGGMLKSWGYRQFARAVLARFAPIAAQPKLTDEAIRAIAAYQEGNGNTLLAFGRAIEQAVLSKLRAPVAEIHVGVSATGRDATICIMQPHADGSITTIYSATHPLGDSMGRVALASTPAVDDGALPPPDAVIGGIPYWDAGHMRLQASAPVADERAAFEAKFPLPAHCQWIGNGYAATDYNAWSAHKHKDRWEGWQARAALASAPVAGERISLRGAANLAFNALHECKPAKGAEKQYSDAIQALQSALHDIAYTVNRTATPQQFAEHLQREARAALASAPIAGERAAELMEEARSEGHSSVAAYVDQLKTSAATYRQERNSARDAVARYRGESIARAALASAPVAGEAQERIEQMAVNRYRPVPDGKFSYKVVAGDGSRSLYTGTKDSCLRVAAKLTEAFLDGAFVASDASPQSSKDGEHGE